MTTVTPALRRLRCTVLLLLSLLYGCATDGGASIEEREAIGPAGEYHVVEKGETLMSIAWKAGIDFKKIARLNHLESPYVIRPGQRLLLKTSDASTKPGTGKRKGKGATNASRSKDGDPHAKAIQEKVANKSPKTVNIGWVWPASGSLIGKFSDSGSVNKGIDVAGKRGDTVVAAGDGTVVYSGPGIVGYGNLIIIKHDDVFLSAYGHNSRLLLGEGSVVKAGQKIAEMGASGTNRDKLHFEIRKNGVPVDPLRYLPER